MEEVLRVWPLAAFQLCSCHTLAAADHWHQSHIPANHQGQYLQEEMGEDLELTGPLVLELGSLGLCFKELA